MALAIFDLDETLIAADSDHLWGQFVVSRGLVDAEEHASRNDAFYEQYKAGKLDIEAYLQFACSVLARHPMEELHAHRSSFVQQCIVPIVLPKAKQIVEEHRSRGDKILIVTSTISFVTRPIADLFNIDTLIAPEPEIVDNQYTGAITGIPSFADGKVVRLRQWLKSEPYDLEGSHFYSDSHNDLPLLRIVDHPIAVDPDPILEAEAREKQWSVISLRD